MTSFYSGPKLNTTLNKIRVMIVEDHELVRTGIKHMLENEASIEVLAEATTGEDAIEISRSTTVDVVLMDVKMPGIGGLESTRRLLRIHPDIKILVVTVCDDSLFPSKLLQAGAYGYLTKGASMKEMVRAIKTVYSGQRYISPEIASQLAIKHLTDEDESPFDKLSERELQVAIMISKGTRVNEVSEQLCLSPKTVNSYRYRIFSKLNINNDVELTHLAIRHNILDNMDMPQEQEE